MDGEQSLSSYGVKEGDTVVLVGTHVNQEKEPPEMWKKTIFSLQRKIQDLENEIDEKDECIAVLSNQITHSNSFVCSI